MQRRLLKFTNNRGEELSAVLELPADRRPTACAIFAHCFTCGKDFKPTRNMTRALTVQGYAVLRFDFTGLGQSEGEFAESSFSQNVNDLVSAAEKMCTLGEAPELIVGHSLGGAAAIVAAHQIPSIKAVATVSSPANPIHVKSQFKEYLDEIAADGEAEVDLAGRPFRIKQEFVDDLARPDMNRLIRTLDRPMMILHSPNDKTVHIDNAKVIYSHAQHPKSFVSLDKADHLLLQPDDSKFVGEVIAHWSRRYIPHRQTKRLATDLEVVARTQDDALTTELLAGRHGFVADEPQDVGGNDYGPTPYDYLVGALGACTNMTLQLYAQRKGWPLEEVETHLEHNQHYVTDQMGEDGKKHRVDTIRRVITLRGELTTEQSQRLLEIANRCPVHRTLTGDLQIETQLEQDAEAAQLAPN